MRALVALAVLLATGCSSSAPAKPLDAVTFGAHQRAMVPTSDLPTWLALVELNRRINHQIVYTSDDKQYGKSEWWAVNPKSNKGDCEDYALTKISELANANLPNVTFYTVRLAVVRVTEDNAKPVRGEVFHAVATWRDSNGNQWVLDNCCDVPFTRKQLERGIMGIKYVWLW